jgi:hypothetical protein
MHYNPLRKPHFFNKNEIHVRESRIEKLEFELEKISKRAGDRSFTNAVKQMGVANPLNENTNEQENKIAALMTVNNALQKKYDRLVKLSGEEDAGHREDWNKK